MQHLNSGDSKSVEKTKLEITCDLTYLRLLTHGPSKYRAALISRVTHECQNVCPDDLTLGIYFEISVHLYDALHEYFRTGFWMRYHHHTAFTDKVNLPSH